MDESCDIDYAKLAQNGIQLLLNNQPEAAEDLFKKYKDDSLHMATGYMYMTFMNALLSFEDEKIQLSLEAIKSLEKKCDVQASGWFSSVKNIVFGSKSTEGDYASYQLEQQITLADCQVLVAILSLMQQEIGSYVKGGWVLRRAWKLYENSYFKIKKLYTSLHESPKSIPHSLPLNLNRDCPPPPSSALSSPGAWPAAHSDTSSSSEVNPSSPRSETNPFPTSDYFSSSSPSSDPPDEPGHPPVPRSNSRLFYFNSYSILGVSARKLLRKIGYSNSYPPYNVESGIATSKSVPNLRGVVNSSLKDSYSQGVMSKSTICRLMASASFGYGIFRLCTSLLPAAWLKFVNMLGLQGDRFEGLEALMFTRKSDDMRAPLATLALLWYHTFIKPYFALEGGGEAVQNGIEAAHLLLEEALQASYSQSSIFIFFKARLHRMQGDVSDALSAYQIVMQQSKQRELQLMALHEVAWCHLLFLDWLKARTAFASLKRESRWCKSFYAYMAAICAGASGKIEDGTAGLSEVPSLARNGGRSLEEFLLKRSKVDEYSINEYFFLVRLYEVLYLWNSFASCSPENLATILKDCTLMKTELDDQMRGLNYLILGHIQTIFDKDEAINSLRTSLQLDQDSPFVQAYSSFELGCLLVENEQTKEEGITYLTTAKEYRHYDFEGRLSMRIDSALQCAQ